MRAFEGQRAVLREPPKAKHPSLGQIRASSSRPAAAECYYWATVPREPACPIANSATSRPASADGKQSGETESTNARSAAAAQQKPSLGGAFFGTQIQNAKTGKCLTIAGGTSPQNNLEAVQFDCDNDPSRTWSFNEIAIKQTLVNAKTGKCLTIAGGTSPANNLTAVQFDCDGDPSRRWLVSRDQSGAFAFHFQNEKTFKCLTIAGGTSPANNLTAVQFDCDGDPSRGWFLKDVGGDAVQIQNAKTGKCLTIAGGTSRQNNLEAVQFDCDSDLSRAWPLGTP